MHTTEKPTQRVAVVTGAARSIGAEIAAELARSGMPVAIHYRSRSAEADALAGRINGAGGQAETFGGDLTEPGASARLLDAVTERFGGIDVVVANAGQPNPGVDVEHGSDAQFAQLLAVNAAAVYALLREAAGRLRSGGRLINIGSSSTLFPSPERALYSASKAASNVLTRAFAAALAPRQITANTVIVGPIDDGFLAGRPAEVLAPLAAASPFGRLGHPDDVAGVVAFLASDAARWITGQQLLVNGGALV